MITTRHIKGRVLVTGATGYLGSQMIVALLECNPDLEVIAWGRQAPERLKNHRLLAPWVHSKSSSRLICVGGDLRENQPFSAIDPYAITHIVHGAGLTRFDIDPISAHRINGEGTQKLLAFAKQCPDLQRIALMGSLYASGKRPGSLDATPWASEAIEPFGFANAYEASKFEAEQMLYAQYSQLPWQVFRVATILSDNAQGQVSHLNAIHHTLHLLYAGLLSVIPGRPEIPIYCMDAERAVTWMMSALFYGPPQRVIHVVPGPEERLSLGEFLETVYHTFQEDPSFFARKVLPPLFCDAEAFQNLVEAVQGFGGDVVNHAVATIAPFAPQLFIEKDFANAVCQAYDPSTVCPPPPQPWVAQVCRSLMEAQWGRRLQAERDNSSLRYVPSPVRP